jgi:hypothetical protein
MSIMNMKLLYSKEQAREYDLHRPLMYWVHCREEFHKRMKTNPEYDKVNTPKIPRKVPVY